MHFELSRDFPALFLALHDLFESNRAITPATVTEELLAGDALDIEEHMLLESEVARALFALSVFPLFQSEYPGVICPKCGELIPLIEAPLRATFLEKSPDLRCPKCDRPSVRDAWRWIGTYQLTTDGARPPSEEIQAMPVYRVSLPDGTVRAIETERAFWQAVEDAALWFLHLPTEKRALALVGYGGEGSLVQRIGAAVTDICLPTDVSGCAALLQVVPVLWDTPYPQIATEDEDDPTPGRIFDITLHGMITERLKTILGEAQRCKGAKPEHV